MPTLTFTKKHALDQLADEIVAAFPAWIVVAPDGERTARFTLTERGDEITLIVPDGTDPAAVASVVTAHVPDATYTPDPQRRQAALYLRNTLGPLLPGLIAGTTTLTTAQRDRSIAALAILMKSLYQRDA